MKKKIFHIKGVALEYNEKDVIPFYGYRCWNCPQTEFKEYLTCVDCYNGQKKMCLSFMKEDQTCIEKSHALVLKRRSYSL